MAKRNIKDILEKLDKGNFTHEEEQVGIRWLLQLRQNEELDFSDQKLSELSDKMWAVIEEKRQYKRKKYKPAYLWPQIIAIAAAIAVIITGVFYFYYYKQRVEYPLNLVVHDIAPGQLNATLTLANGKKIRLSGAANGEIAEEEGVRVTKSGDGQLIYEIGRSIRNRSKFNTLSTAKGETYILRLPDQSKVWLNAASSLTYATRLSEDGLRRVKLEGEAYFEVFKDKAHPFIVETNNQKVEVLGTHFNINSYSDESSTMTTLLEGSVKVTSGNLKQILNPGQQARNNGRSIEVSTADLESVVDWREGSFFLNRVNFRTAMRKIARWYNVDVFYEESVPNDMESSGYISRNNKLSDVLKSIEKSGQVHFRMEGRKIYVSK